MPETSTLFDILLRRVMEHRQTLSRAEAQALLEDLLTAGVEGRELRIAALLGALAARGETIPEIAGFVDALRASVTRIPLTESERHRLVDTCGTGGDQGGTFNISTAAALVAAAAGALVAKHGNRAITSRCGSADVLEALGIPVDLAPDAAAEAIRTHGFAFLPAPSLQPALKAIGPLRRALGIRTVFNILGPMTNPAGARAQVLGVYAPHLVPVVAETLAMLNTRHAFVVHGGGMDEFSLSSPTEVAEVQGTDIAFRTVKPEDFGLRSAPLEALAGSTAWGNAAILCAIFAGEQGPRRDVVVLNAAAVLVTAQLARNIASGVALAQATIDAGKVLTLIQQLGGTPWHESPA